MFVTLSSYISWVLLVKKKNPAGIHFFYLVSLIDSFICSYSASIALTLKRSWADLILRQLLIGIVMAVPTNMLGEV